MATKKQLEAQIEEHKRVWRETNRELESVFMELNDLVEELSDIFFPRVEGKYGGYDKAPKPAKEVKAAIIACKARLDGMEAEGRKLTPLIVDTLSKENTKLWHMIRVAMNDEKREEPIQKSMERPLFRRPDFDL